MEKCSWSSGYSTGKKNTKKNNFLNFRITLLKGCCLILWVVFVCTKVSFDWFVCCWQVILRAWPWCSTFNDVLATIFSTRIFRRLWSSLCRGFPSGSNQRRFRLGSRSASRHYSRWVQPEISWIYSSSLYRYHRLIFLIKLFPVEERRRFHLHENNERNILIFGFNQYFSNTNQIKKGYLWT